jgi:hypothetical protein
VLNPARLFITESAYQAEKTDPKATAVIVHEATCCMNSSLSNQRRVLVVGGERAALVGP